MTVPGLALKRTSLLNIAFRLNVAFGSRPLPEAEPKYTVEDHLLPEDALDRVTTYVQVVTMEYRFKDGSGGFLSKSDDIPLTLSIAFMTSFEMHPQALSPEADQSCYEAALRIAVPYLRQISHTILSTTVHNPIAPAPLIPMEALERLPRGARV